MKIFSSNMSKYFYFTGSLPINFTLRHSLFVLDKQSASQINIESKNYHRYIM